VHFAALGLAGDPKSRYLFDRRFLFVHSPNIGKTWPLP
jgi:hypothetical protein